uniref:TlpA family protein disulfide reductase n=1 Tax=Clostridium sp. 12(A) TaxID=1163671 RepID=UPI0004631A71|nr:TlpA disulfide reductase family protein [Clostridium sp. 12(A)]
MKRIKNYVAIALATVTILTTVSGCSPTQKVETNGALPVNSDGNVTTEVKERGLKFTISQEYMDKGVTLEGYNQNLDGYRIVSITYYSPTATEALETIINMDEEKRTKEVSDEYTQKIWNTSRTIMDIVMLETDEYKKLVDSGTSLDKITGYSPSEELGTNDGYTYIISIPDLDNGDLSEDEIKQYNQCKEYMKTVKENLSFIPVELENTDTVLGETMPSFTTNDLNGNAVTNDIFGKKKLTVVNVWGTFCGPCIEEMPELQKWSEEMSDNVQIIGLVGDIEGENDKKHLDLAKKIVNKAGVNFTNLIANDDFKDMMSGIIGFPTTFLVDQNGAIVGDPIVGAEMDSYKSAVEAYLNGNAN